MMLGFAAPVRLGNGATHGGEGVIHDHQGRWIEGCFASGDDSNAFQAEVLALLGILKLAWVKGFRKVYCDVDCAELVATLENASAIQLHAEFLVLFEIASLLQQAWEVHLSCVHMDSNFVADLLAKRGACGVSFGF
ncbi:uncharacterized protein LOC130713080 [Lotus japonicus]|uniref:uncharacterized protein LOC130713080 n=1 Tax=Lotus japonicus TaxID=34305 RepID=UPI0025854263|nr:uncharacterized protein LOC130713080 [Lotus japonicus]